jgi:predicted hydrocarbon binding protein
VQPRVSIDVDAATGVWSTDGLPMLYVPRHFLINNHLMTESALGRERYAHMLYEPGHRSAWFWCASEAKTHGLAGIAVFEHYLQRLSQRGWGQFGIASVDVAGARAEISVQHSAFVLGVPEARGRRCYMFAGWFAGAMDWVAQGSGRELRTTCSEIQCAGDGATHCVFSVSP